MTDYSHIVPDRLILSRNPTSTEVCCRSWEDALLRIDEDGEASIETRTRYGHQDGVPIAEWEGRVRIYRLASSEHGVRALDVARLRRDLEEGGRLSHIIDQGLGDDDWWDEDYTDEGADVWGASEWLYGQESSASIAADLEPSAKLHEVSLDDAAKLLSVSGRKAKNIEGQFCTPISLRARPMGSPPADGPQHQHQRHGDADQDQNFDHVSRISAISSRLSWYNHPMNRLAFVVALLLASCSPKPGEYVIYSLSESDIGSIQNGIRSSLKDPDSAQFSGIVSARGPDGVIKVCGQVNAKNSFGGYVGAKYFYGTLEPGGFQLVMMDSPSNNSGAWPAIFRCKRAGLLPS